MISINGLVVSTYYIMQIHIHNKSCITFIHSPMQTLQYSIQFKLNVKHWVQIIITMENNNDNLKLDYFTTLSYS